MGTVLACGGSVFASYGDKCSLWVSAFGDSHPTPVGILWGLAASAILSTGDYRHRRLSCSHTFHCYRLTLRLKRKTSGLLCMCVAPCHPWHRDISPSMDKPFAFLNALSPALIDAIPLNCSLSKETSSGLGLWGNDVETRAGEVGCYLPPVLTRKRGHS